MAASLIREIKYRLIDSVAKYGKMRANPDAWAWKVYAGEDGSVIAFKPSHCGRGRSKSVGSPMFTRLGQTRNDNGYWRVSIERQGNAKSRKYDSVHVHFLIALAFDQAARVRETVRHLDGDKDNNDASNVRWGTREDQERDKNNPTAKRRTEAIVASRKNIRILLAFGHEGTPLPARVYMNERRNGGDREITAELPNLHDAKWKKFRNARHQLDQILYRFDLWNRKITSIEAAMPEKCERDLGFYTLTYSEREEGQYEIDWPFADRDDDEFTRRIDYLAGDVCFSLCDQMTLPFNWVPYGRRFSDDECRAFKGGFLSW